MEPKKDASFIPTGKPAEETLQPSTEILKRRQPPIQQEKEPKRPNSSEKGTEETTRSKFYVNTDSSSFTSTVSWKNKDEPTPSEYFGADPSSFISKAPPAGESPLYPISEVSGFSVDSETGVKVRPSKKGVTVANTYAESSVKTSETLADAQTTYNDVTSEDVRDSSMEVDRGEFTSISDYSTVNQKESVQSRNESWSVRDSSTYQAMFEEFVSDTNYVDEQNAPPAAQETKAKNAKSCARKLELLYLNKFCDENKSDTNSVDPTELTKQQQLMELLASYFPDASDYIEELDKLDVAKQEEILNAIEMLDSEIFYDSDESKENLAEDMSYSSDQSSTTSGTGGDWLTFSSSNAMVPSLDASGERELRVTTYLDQNQPQTPSTCSRTVQTDDCSTSASASFIFQLHDVEQDIGKRYRYLSSRMLSYDSDSSSSSDSDDDDRVTVKFRMENEDVHYLMYDMEETTEKMKADMARITELLTKNILLKKDGVKVEDGTCLSEMGAEPFGTIEVYVFIVEAIETPIISTTSFHDIPMVMPVKRNVIVRWDTGVVKRVVVQVWKLPIEKPWLGGVHNIKTSKVCHHAYSQTPPRQTTTTKKLERATQTTLSHNKNTCTKVDHSTQVYTARAYIPCVGDKIISAKKYVTFAEIYVQHQFKLRKVVTIQRYLRAWLIRRLIKTASAEYRKRVAHDDAIKTNVANDIIRHRQKEMERKVYPQSRADYETLYSCVEKWRVGQIHRIKTLKANSKEKKRQLVAMLTKEVSLLKALEDHRVKLRDEKKEKNEFAFLRKSSQPIQWTNEKCELITMDTLETQRAREMYHLYMSLSDVDATPEDRLSLLLALKLALKRYYKPADPKRGEMLKLIVRECDLLARGHEHDVLDILRRRLRQLFLDFMRDPTNNSEAGKFSGKMVTTAINTRDMYRCSSCGQFRTQQCFPKTTLTKVLRHCVACSWLKNVAGLRIDLGPYRNMMHALRCDEERRCCTLSVAYMMQEADFYFLICKIWHSRSAISECGDLARLRISRWNVKKDWSPWNCILLDEVETKAHDLLMNLDELYDESFVKKVRAKHQLGRKHFDKLAGVDQDIRDSGKWFKKDRPVKYVVSKAVPHGYR